ncbi:GTP-binding protein Rho1, partial [Serendipita sp. 399]
MFESRVTDVKIDERRFELEIVDTAGQEDYEQIRLRSYPNSDVALICFSVDEPDSLEHVVEKWAPEVMHFCPEIPYIVVGCKTDLRFNSRVLEYLTRIGQKPTTPGEGQAVARKSSAEMYLECSSLAGNGVEEVFEHATRAALAAKGKPKKNKR